MGIPEEPTEKRSDTDGEVLTFMRLQEKYKQVYQPHEIAAWWEDLGVLIEMAPVQEPTEKRSDTDGEVLTFMRLQEKYKQVYQPHEIAAWWEDGCVLLELAPLQEEHAASSIQDA